MRVVGRVWSGSDGVAALARRSPRACGRLSSGPDAVRPLGRSGPVGRLIGVDGLLADASRVRRGLWSPFKRPGCRPPPRSVRSGRTLDRVDGLLADASRFAAPVVAFQAARIRPPPRSVTSGRTLDWGRRIARRLPRPGSPRSPFKRPGCRPPAWSVRSGWRLVGYPLWLFGRGTSFGHTSRSVLAENDSAAGEHVRSNTCAMSVLGGRIWSGEGGDVVTSHRRSERSSGGTATPPSAVPGRPDEAVTIGARRVVAALAERAARGVATSGSTSSANASR